MGATGHEIEHESLAKRGLSNSERVTCLLIASEHAIKIKQDFPTTEQLRSLVVKLETRLTETSKPERPTHYDERIDNICRGSDREKIIAATIACLLVGDSVRVKMPSHSIINIGSTTDPGIVLERHPSPFADLLTEWQTHPKPHRITPLSIAYALSSGELLEAIIDDRDADTGLDTEQLETLKRICANDPKIDDRTLASELGASWEVVSRVRAQHCLKRQVRVTTTASMLRRPGIELVRQPKPATKKERRTGASSVVRQTKQPRIIAPATPQDPKYAKSIRNGQLRLDRLEAASTQPPKRSAKMRRYSIGLQSLIQEIEQQPETPDEINHQTALATEVVRWINQMEYAQQNLKPHRRKREKLPNTMSNCNARNTGAS
jgi:hypothetical protein